jgi:DNA-binding NtrC family response regulator
MGIFAGGKTTVLVVEDEALLRLVAVGELEDAGMATLEAENGSQALEILGCNRSIDVVFTDIDMPGAINGIELANIVRETYPHMRVIVVSGLSNIENTTLHKAIPFYSKPYDMARIIEQMQAIERIARPQDQTQSDI